MRYVVMTAVLLTASPSVAQRQLYGLEPFQFATIDTQEDGELERVPTRVTIAEGDHRCLRLSERTRFGVTYTHEFTRSEVSNAALNDLTQRDTLIALGLDRTSGWQDGVLSSIAVNVDHADHRRPAEPATRPFSVAAAGAGGLCAARRFQLHQPQRRSPRVPPDRQPVGGRRTRACLGERSGRWCRQRAVLQALFPGRIEQPPRMGTVRGRAAVCCRSAALRIQPARSQSGAARRVWNSLGLVVFGDAGNVWRARGNTGYPTSATTSAPDSGTSRR
jgi:hypothetical protein